MYSHHRLPVTVVSLLTVLSILAFISLAWNAPALGAEPTETLVLVARPALSDPIYGRSILVAHEMPGGQHVGFILNKPTELRMAEAFPGHAASKTVTDPLYLGGPSVAAEHLVFPGGTSSNSVQNMKARGCRWPRCRSSIEPAQLRRNQSCCYFFSYLLPCTS